MDLLVHNRTNLRIFHDRSKDLKVTDATSVRVSSAEEAEALREQGALERVTAETNMNRLSSRSHSIFVLTVCRQEPNEGRQRFAQLYLVDLAGSESVYKSGAKGIRLMEAGHINKSLLTLGMCVNALAVGESHVP